MLIGEQVLNGADRGSLGWFYFVFAFGLRLDEKRHGLSDEVRQVFCLIFIRA